MTDLENVYNSFHKYANENHDMEFFIDEFFDKNTYKLFFSIINTLLRNQLLDLNSNNPDNKNNSSINSTKLLTNLQITEKTFLIVNLFHNNYDQKIKELYTTILENVIIKYVELEYLNNPNLYSRKAPGKSNSISSQSQIPGFSNELNTNIYFIDELKLNLKYSFLKLTYHIIELLSFKSFLDIVSFDENEKDNFSYLKLDLISKILENLPCLNIEENFERLICIFHRNLDRNVKIDSIIYVCLKKIKTLFSNSFEEKLKKISDDCISNQILEFINENSNNNCNNTLCGAESLSANLNKNLYSDSNNNVITNGNNELSREIEVTKAKNDQERLIKTDSNINIINKNSENKVKEEKNTEPKRISVKKLYEVNNLDNEVIKVNDSPVEPVELKTEENFLVEKNDKKSKKEDLIIIDMDNSKIVKPPPLKRDLNNRSNNKIVKRSNEEAKEKPEEKILEESNINIYKTKDTIENKLSSEDNLIKSKVNKNDNFEKKDEMELTKNTKSFISLDDVVVGGKKLQNNDPESSNNNNSNNDNFNNVEDEAIEKKKKKEKDLADFEKMLEEQMRLESKRLEEQGIDGSNINEGARKRNPRNTTNSSKSAVRKTAATPANAGEEEKATEISSSSKNLIIVDVNNSVVPNKLNSEKSNVNNANINNTTKQLKNVSELEQAKGEKKVKQDLSTSNKANVSNTGKEADEEDEKYSKLNKSEVEDFMNNLLGKEIADLLNSEKWNERKEGFVKIYDWIESQKDNFNILKANFDNLILFLKIKLKDFKENNFNILREVFIIYIELIKLFAVKKIFDRRTCNSLLKAFWERISEVKIKENLTNLFFTIMEYFTPSFVITYLLKKLEKSKNSLLKEYAQLFEKTIEEFGMSTIPVKDIVEFCKLMSLNTNPQVRNASTALLCVLYKYIGKDLKTLLIKDVKEATYKLIEGELNKVTVIENVNTLAAKRNIVSDEADGGEKKNGGAKCNSGNMIENLIPRVDISKKITPKIIKDLNEGKWGDKKAAFEAIEKILIDANNKILPNGLNEIFLTVCKSRLNDGNKNVVRMIVQLITKLIDALGNNFKSLPNGIFKNITPLVIANLADKMILLREDVLICMDKWTLNAGIENIIIYIPEHLKNDNFELRTDLFKYLHKHKEVLEKSPAAAAILKDFVSPILKCLQDKVQSIRTAAEEFILFSLKFIPISNFHIGLKDFKSAIQNDLKKILDNAQNNYLMNLNNVSEKENSNNTNSNNIEFNSQGSFNIPNNDMKNFTLKNTDLVSMNVNNIAQNNNPNNTLQHQNSNKNFNNSNNNSDNVHTLSNNNNDNELKQDSRISNKNYSATYENLQTNSTTLAANKNSNNNSNNNYSSKSNSKKIFNINGDKSGHKDKSTERKIVIKPTDANNANNKTPEPRQDNNAHSDKTPDSRQNNISNFAADNSSNKLKTPNQNINKTGNKTSKNSKTVLSHINRSQIQQETLNTINQDDNNLLSCLSSNSSIITTNHPNNAKLKNDSKTIGVSPRVIGKAGLNSQLANKKNQGLQSWAIFQANITLKLAKEKRFEQDKKNKFNLDAPSNEYISKLKENLNSVFIPEYVSKLLSDDIKNNVEAINLIINYLSEHAIETGFGVFEYFDIFLKWILWKINQNQNPSIIKALLELFEILANIFIQQFEGEYKLNDIEIYIIINCLCERLGNPSEKIREQTRELLLEKYYCNIISPAKISAELVNIISNNTKNSKLRVECFEILVYLYNLNIENNSNNPETALGNILTQKDAKSLIKTYINAKNTDLLKNKLQDFIFAFILEMQQETNNSNCYLIYLNELDPKSKDIFTQKLNTWLKSQNSYINTPNALSNKNSNNLNNNISNSSINATLTPRLDSSIDSVARKKDFETINKLDESISARNTPTAVGKTISRNKEKSDNNLNNLGNTINKKMGLSPNNVNNKTKSIYNYTKEDLSNTTKAVKSRNVTSKIQNVNISTSMDESQSIANNANKDKNNIIMSTTKGNNVKSNTNALLSSTMSTINNNNGNNTMNIAYNNNNLNTISNTNESFIKNKTYSLEDKEDLLFILDNLNNENENEKVNTILIIHDIIHAKFDMSKHILIPNIDELINAFIIALKKLFENANKNVNNVPVKLGKYLITVLYKISSNKELIKNISYQVLFNLSEEVLSNLLIENLDKIGENQEGLVIIRSLNSTMLRILENCDYTQVIEVLFDIVMKYRDSQEKAKVAGLGIKCLLKIHQILEQIIKQVKVDKLLLKIHLIFLQIDKTNHGLDSENQTDQMIIRFIKNLIYELVKIKKGEIIGDYRLVEKNKEKDKYIKKWIKSILQTLENETIQKMNNISNDASNLDINTNKVEDGQRNNKNKVSYIEYLSPGKINTKSTTPVKKNGNNTNNNNNLEDTINNERDLSVIMKKFVFII